MKCSKCGNDISRRAVFCSNCGAEINENYQAVNDAIINSASSVNTKILRILSIAFAILLASGLVITAKVSYRYNDYHSYAKSDKYAKKHIEELDAILAEGDYFEIDRYYDAKKIRFEYEDEKETHYNAMGYAATNFRHLMNYALEIQFSDTLRSTSTGSMIAGQVNSLLGAIETAESYEEGSFAKKYFECCNSDLNMILKVYFNVKDDELLLIRNSTLAENTIFFDAKVKELYDEKK